MKQNVSPLLIAGIIVVVVVLVGFIAKRTLFQDPNYSPVPWEETRAYKEQQRAQAARQSSAVPDAAANVEKASSHPRGALAGGQ